jgi:hypothetical protein
MQCIYPCGLSPEQYQRSEGHRAVRASGVCPRCGESAGLQRHGSYARWITGEVGRCLRVAIARFLCRACGGTVSYLPDFALPYRLVAVASFEAYLDGECGRADVQRCEGLLREYRRGLEGFSVELVRCVGCGWGRAPPPQGGLWPWLREACGSLATAARRLVSEFNIGLFKRYQCHQPRAAAR